MARAAFALIALLLLLPAASAYRAGAMQLYPFESRDFGNQSQPQFDMTLMMDCNAANISAYVRSGGQPVQGVTSYLKYVQYDHPLVSSGITGSTGQVSHKLTGNISYMTGIFVLTAEKAGYQRREAHFDINDCFISAPAQPPAQPQQNSSQQPPASQNTSGNNGAAASANASGNASAAGSGANATGNGTPNTGNGTPGTGSGAPGAAKSVCPSALILAGALVLGSLRVRRA